MQCPKCGFEQDDGNTECAKCGVIFSKYSPRPPAPVTTRKEGVFGQLLFGVEADYNTIAFWGRAALLFALAALSWVFAVSSFSGDVNPGGFMHFVNLPFHEAGHLVFSPFGDFIASLGGTLGQFLMPLIALGVLLIQTRDPFGAAVSLWWFGQNFFDIAPYVNDARDLSLPLLGGNYGHSTPYGFHDWEYLLTESGLLKYDHFLAKTSCVLGTLVMLTAFAWAGFLLYRQYKNLKQT